MQGSCRTLIRSAILLSLGAIGTPLAIAQNAFKVDVPSQDLADALRVVGRQTSTNIIFEPAIVKGVRVAQLRAEVTADQAIDKLLEGTQLTAQRTSNDTIIVAKRRPAATAPHSATEHSTTDLRGDQQPSFWDRFRLARVDQGSPVEETPPAGTQRTETPVALAEVVVTGTHLRGVGSPVSPTIILDRTYIERSGFQTAGDIVRSLPQSFSGGLNANVVGAGGAQNTASQSGASTVNLRGLGSDSTLTLVNGQRLASAEGVGAADISMIPLSAIERVEVVTDGASAIYGSDAVGGVVNFVLRKDLSGVNADAAFGSATEGGGTQQRYGLLGGTQWSSGQALVTYEFGRQNVIDAEDRDYISPNLAGTSLLPRSERHSVFLNANQDLGAVFDLALQALYTKRQSDSFTNTSVLGQPGRINLAAADTQQYGVTSILGARLSDSWRASLTADVSGNDTDQDASATINAAPCVAAGCSSSLTFDNRLRSLELKSDGVLLVLPTGAVKLAVGAGYREETFFTGTLPAIVPSVSAKRHVRHAFTETLVPLVSPSSARPGLHSLDLSMAARYEDYSDFSSSTNPRFGLAYKPSDGMTIRASWGRSFHAPSLLQEYNSMQALLFPITDPNAVSGRSLALLLSGGNRELQPERARGYTLALEAAPSELPGAKLDLSYFNLNYDGRIVRPLTSSFTALTDPFAPPFVIRNPGADLVSQIVAQSAFLNFSGGAFDPAAVGAIVANQFQNASKQRVSGVDAVASYALTTAGLGRFDWAINATYLDISQKLTPLQPTRTLTGSVFNPPRVRARGSFSWSGAEWSSSLFLNYSGTSKDIASIPQRAVASWTTLDAQVAYAFPDTLRFSKTRVALSAQNVLDRDPPYVAASQSGLPGINFDSTNASAVGRFVTVQLSTAF